MSRLLCICHRAYPPLGSSGVASWISAMPVCAYWWSIVMVALFRLSLSELQPSSLVLS